MATNKVNSKSASAAHHPNFLEQMGGRLHEMLVGKKSAPNPAPKPAAKKAAPTVGAAKPAPKPTTATTQRASSAPARNVSAKHEEAAKNGVVGRGSAAKKPEICWAPLTMKSADGSSRYCISKNTKGAGYTARDPKGDIVTLHIKQLKDSHAALKPTSNKYTHAGRVRREGTALQKQEWSKASQGMPTKTEFKQGGADPLPGMADGPRRSVNTLVHVGQKMAHSRIIGVAQLGEGIGMATDAVRGLNSAVHHAPKFFQRSNDLVSGRTPTTAPELIAGVVSGAGKVAGALGSGAVSLVARVVVPGVWSDNVTKALGAGQQRLDDGYRGAVKNAGVDPDSKGYSVASTATQIVGTAFLAAKSMTGSATTKAANVGAKGAKGVKGAKGANSVPNTKSVPKSVQHPVESLKNAVNQYREGKISGAALNEAMSRANEAFQTQKGPEALSWSPQIRKDYVTHNVEANRAVGGGN